MKDELLFCPLGGSGEIGMNMNLFGYGQPSDHKWIMVDIGVTFADDTIPNDKDKWKVSKRAAKRKFGEASSEAKKRYVQKHYRESGGTFK